MNYHNILHDNMLNGEGLRVVLFVSGCEHNCKGCQNPQTHDFNSGIPFTQAEKNEIFHYLSKPYTQGLTISGGDPLHPLNYPTVLSLCKEVKSKFPNKDIWIYTGYDVRHLNRQKEYNEIFYYVDVIVDGKYDESYRDVNVPYVGSTNQRICHINAGGKTSGMYAIACYDMTKDYDEDGIY